MPELFPRLQKAADKWGLNYEVICVDDGSRDSTLALLKAQNSKDSRWNCVSFSRNFGHQIAVSAGIYHARGDAVLIMDADLQDPPEEAHRFIEKWQQGYDVVYGVRTKRSDPIWKRFTCWLFYRLMANVASLKVPLDSGDFCLLDRRVVDTINAMPEHNRFVRGLRAWTGFKQTGVEFERQGRVAGTPQYTLKKLIQLALDGMLSFSIVPLRLAFYFGLLLIPASIIIALVAAQHTRTEFVLIIFLITFFVGIQLIAIGILGEYIGRIYDETRGRPLWIVKESIGLKKHDSSK